MTTYTSFLCHWLLLPALLLLTTLSASAQTVLLTESFDGGAGTTPPAGWSTEQVSGTAGQVSFLTSGTHPTITPYDGSRLVEFNSWTATAGNATRLKRILPVSTTGYMAISVDFAWYEDPAYSVYNDSVIVQWSTDGLSWQWAGGFGRYNTVTGWKIKTLFLPPDAAGQPTLFVAFLFRSAQGNNCHIDLMHLSGAPALPGTSVLTGKITSCYNNMPVNGATVTCGPLAATSNSSGDYILYNVPVGSQTITISAPSFLLLTKQVQIQNQQVNWSDICLSPTPAYLTGVITNLESGAPIIGAKISAGGSVTYSTAGGLYTLHVYPCGHYTVLITKAGFDFMAFGPLPFVCGNTEVFNAQMHPMTNPPGEGTGTLNPGQTAVDLSWQFPEGPYELLYDDGIQDDFLIGLPATKYAVRFTPVDYPAMVTGGKIHIGESSNYGTGTNLPPFQIAVYDASGPGGLPGQPIGAMYDITPVDFGWIEFTFPPAVEISSGSFYLVMISGSTIGPGVATDTTAPQLRSYIWPGGSSGPWVPANGNLMIRATLHGPGGPVPLDATGQTNNDPGDFSAPDIASAYQFWRLKQGQESTPTVWESLGVNGTPDFTDSDWPSLPCAPYRWACKAIYTSGSISPPSFTNVIGKCWTASITIHTNSCCSLSTINPHPAARIINTSNPDTIYSFHPDSTGYATVPNVWKGNYNLECVIFTCEAYSSNFNAYDDDTLYVQLLGPYPVPPSNVHVDKRSLLATWNAPIPRQTIFEENWQSGSYLLNQWIEDPPGSNWNISNVFGNPSPSVQFNSTPSVINYTHYLTSDFIIDPMNAPYVTLQYDFYLNNFSTSTVENMATEVWDGSSWTQVYNHTNQTGSIPWTTMHVDISAFTNDDIKIRFKASGADSYNINQWNVDNIKVIARDSMTSPCHLGYLASLTPMLGAFTYDTSYLIPPNLVTYGQTYTFCVNSVFTSGGSDTVCDTFTSEFLYPVGNFKVTPIECAVILSWDIPVDLNTGLPPAGLQGYNIYRFGEMYHQINDPTVSSFTDADVNPGLYIYEMTAIYDLTPYGFPGEEGESQLSMAPAVQVACGPILPFGEGWDNGTFTYNEWTFFPDQGNWNICVSDEGESPWAGFSWEPIQTNYHYELISRALDATPWGCASIWLDAEVKLVDRYATGTEHLLIELWCDNTWTTLYTLSNTGSTDWVLLHLNIGQVSGKGFRIRFVAEGENSSNILHWYVDNINLYGECLPPVNLDLSVNGELVNLFWEAPNCEDLSGLEGYHLFRSNAGGLPPFIPVGTILAPATSFTDEPGSAGLYRYFATACFILQSTGDSLCESVATDTIPALVVADGPLHQASVRVYPNPVRDALAVESTEPINRIELFSVSGTIALTMELSHSLTARVPLETVLPGTYLIRIITDRSAYHQKIVVTK